jgi:hypothetical protein
MTRDYEAATGASITRVHGSHGWRVFEWDNGAVHCYEWKHLWLDLRCAYCKSPEFREVFMVTDELWASSGLAGYVCFRCLEQAIGRRLVPADFKPEVLANADAEYHSPELLARMGLS